MKIRLTHWGVAIALCFNAGWLMAQGAAGDGQGNRAPMPMSTTYEILAEIDAGAHVWAEWPGADETWHHGVGFMDPFGAVEYYCGKGFPEFEDFDTPQWGLDLFVGLTGRETSDPLRCLYTTDEGTFYVLDSVPGTLMRGDNYGRDLIFNLVVGGTGAYKGATGVWIGRTEGMGDRVQLNEKRSGRQTLLKVMRGYVKIPDQTTVD